MDFITDPEKMSPSERLSEIAAILALGYLRRLRKIPELAAPADSLDSRLNSRCEQRLHWKWGYRPVYWAGDSRRIVTSPEAITKVDVMLRECSLPRLNCREAQDDVPSVGPENFVAPVLTPFETDRTGVSARPGGSCWRENEVGDRRRTRLFSSSATGCAVVTSQTGALGCYAACLS